MKLRTLPAILLAAGLITPALAQEFTFDADESGDVTEEEWTTFGEQSFAEADADQSGFVDEDEFNQYAETNWGGAPGGGDDDGPLFGLLDTNDDVQVTEDEWFGNESFVELDDDESGALEENELGTW